MIDAEIEIKGENVDKLPIEVKADLGRYLTRLQLKGKLGRDQLIEIAEDLKLLPFVEIHPLLNQVEINDLES